MPASRGWPCAAGGIPWSKFPALIPDDGEIRHPLLGRLHGVEPLAFAEQGEVGPQDAAEEAHAIDDDLVVVQDVDVLRRLRLQFLDQSQVVMVELMVAGHVDHRPVREPGFRPAQAFQADTDITGQDHDIGIGCRRLEVLEFDVQVIEDVEFHGTTLHQ